MDESRDPTLDPRDVERGRKLNELFDAELGDAAVRSEKLRPDDAELAREMREYAGLVRDLGLARGGLNALIAHGVLDKSDDPRYPARLGPYKIIGCLGRGGMGLVFKAYEESLRRTIALKLLRPELCQDAAAVERFTREARAAAALNHPNIVTVYAVGEHRGVHYIAMEYVAGPSLAEVIRESYPLSAVSSWPSAISRQSSDVGVEQTNGGDPSAIDPSRQPEALNQEPSVSKAERQKDNPEHEAQAGDTPQESEKSQMSDESRVRDETSDEDGTQVGCATRSGGPKRLTLDSATVREIFRQLLEALAAAHAAGLIHRDVKSSNILIEIQGNEATQKQGNEATRQRGNEGAPLPSLNPEPRTLNPAFRVKLADFGLARMAGSQTRLTAADATPGTPEYMSPEQARGDEDVDHRTDLYSAGVVLYEMLTGRTPFKAETPSGVIRLICHLDPPPFKVVDVKIDPILASLALRLLAKVPADRFESAQAAIAVLGTVQPIMLPHRRRRTLRLTGILTAGVVALTTIALGASLFFKRLSGIASDTFKFRDIHHLQVIDNNTHVAATLNNGATLQLPWINNIVPNDISGAQVVTFLSNGQITRILVVSSSSPFDEERNVLIAFNDDDNHSERWRRSLMPSPPIEWPDDDKPGAFWGCCDLYVWELDNQPGQEILVNARHETQYPTRVSMIDPATGSVRDTFWHVGIINFITYGPMLLGDSHPGLILSGVNNLFDVRNERNSDEKTETIYDVVPVLLILDPQNMGGISPPWTYKFDIHHADIVSYGFLDLPANHLERASDGTKQLHKHPNVKKVGFDVPIITNDFDPPKAVFRCKLEENDSLFPRFSYEVYFDHNLNVVSASPNDNAPKWLTLEEFKSLWKQIIREDKEVVE